LSPLSSGEEDVVPHTDEESGTGWAETMVAYGEHHLRVRDHPGPEPAIVLMHGFPDDLHLYDRLVPYLSPTGGS
jgi:hypothetical protein